MICLYFGSFNPLHRSHLELAQYARNQLGFAEVWFVLSPLNPQKDPRNQLPYELRKEIICDAIDGQDGYRVISLEKDMPRPLYTIRTIQALKLLYPHEEFALLVGSDNLLSFTSWYRWEDLLHLVRLYVYPRPDYPMAEADSRISYVPCPEAPLTYLSSSDVRRLISEHADASNMLASPRSWQRLLSYYSSVHPSEPLASEG